MGSLRPARSSALRGAVTLAALVLLGCAQGGGGADSGGGHGRDAGPPRDSGHMGFDAGSHDSGPSGCSSHGNGSSCAFATDLGMVAVGGMVQSMVGLVPQHQEQWVRVSFPASSTSDAGMPAGDGGTSAAGGMPNIEFLQNDADSYRFEIRTTCTTVAGCGGAAAPGGMMATDLTTWSFTDDPMSSMPGPGQLSSRMVPWPSVVYIRVYPQADPACHQYQLQITR